MQNFKKACFQECMCILENRLTSYEQDLNHLKETASNEQKSSMGDKYETTTELLAQEREKILSQIAEIKKQINTLLKVEKSIDKPGNQIAQGSLVKTDKAYFFISISLGKVITEGKEVYVLSENAPMAKLFLNQTTGKSVTFNGVSHKIVGHS